MSAVGLMGYGCKDVVASASTKQSDTQLHAKLEENAAALREQKGLENQSTLVVSDEKSPQVDLNGIICIGDSVMLGSSQQIAQVLPNSYLGKDRHIFRVNVYCPNLKWQDTNNTYLQKMAQEHSNVTIVDWYSLISQHPEWLVKDGIHPNDAGAVEYAKLLHDSIVQTLSTEKAGANNVEN